MASNFGSDILTKKKFWVFKSKKKPMKKEFLIKTWRWSYNG